ncbi:putative serine protease K12H4.7 [Lingula anatina]|uniref:Serine protease K12H4.7 n=1 Tax=Lingula anatina TaxID=7574 RepID=A0A1S3K8X9_LINAN|nr:putative serine protease K12H4.7 [Lingula anatina]|eukprot:XP_013419073.1 putative serine protease K12H4.7 [Lingula anatina]
MATSRAVLLLLFLGSCGGVRLFHRGRPRGGMVGVPAVNWEHELPPDQWIEQQLDHFNDADARTWKQRYFVNATFYKPGGPVFIQIGGEGTADPIWMVTGQWIKNAEIYNAICFQVEHRFYGKSHPTPDMSVDNLRYLNSEQALADLAHFREYMGRKMNLTNAKWITFGGSYPGSLSAWFRLKYPHLVHAAVATSAPMFALLNFKDYLSVVRDALDTTATGTMCNKLIGVAVDAVSQAIKTDQGKKMMKEKFRLCDNLDGASPNDIANLFSTLAGNFEGVVQYNKDNRAFEGAVGTNITIDTLCGLMAAQRADPLTGFSMVNSLILDTYKQPCLDFSYKNMIKELQLTDWNSSAAEGGRQWTYQTCTEFGWYQSSDLTDQPFGHMFPVSFSVQQCKDIFGDKFTQALNVQGINRTNTNYGGYGIKVSRILFPNGSIDPWHALGITKDLTPDARAIFIKGTAHCANMYPDSPSDSPQLVAARMAIRKQIGQWLQS